MYIDFYTKEAFKGSGVKDYQGNKINPTYAVKVSGFAKNLIASRHDPNIVPDAIEPKKYVCTARSNELYAEAEGKVYRFGFTMVSTNELAMYYNEKGQSYFIGEQQAKSIPNTIEHIESGCFCHKAVQKSIGGRKYERFSHPHVNKDSYQDCMKFGTISPTNLISEGKSYTFGVEIETYKGFIPTYVRRNLNMDCQYDGSIRNDKGEKDTGGEYTTGVLKGDNGFAHLYKICYELSRRCAINNTCSVHVHLGNIVFNKEFVVLVYKVLEDIEDELFSMMPPSRKVREHCQPMKKLKINLKKRGVPYDILINSYYKTIVKIVSLGRDLGPKINKEVNHPLGRYCGYDRGTPRYWWCNFVPTLFNIKGVGNHTIEIRNHSATMDFVKIKNWVLICMGIVSYVESHKSRILLGAKTSIHDIIKLTYPNKGAYLSKYIKDRTEYFNPEDPHVVTKELAEYAPGNNLNTVELQSIKQIVTM